MCLLYTLLIRKTQGLLLSCLLVPPQDCAPSLCLGYFRMSEACSWHNSESCFVLVFLKEFFVLFLEGKARREGEKHQCVVTSHVPPTGDLACNPGMCPHWESNPQPLVHRPALNPLSHTSQGWSSLLREWFEVLVVAGARVLDWQSLDLSSESM